MITGTLGGKEVELGESSDRPRSHSGVACVVQDPHQAAVTTSGLMESAGGQPFSYMCRPHSKGMV